MYMANMFGPVLTPCLFKVKPGMGKGEEFGYNSPEFFQYDKYSYFDIEKEVVDGKKRVEQPKSGLTEFW